MSVVDLAEYRHRLAERLTEEEIIFLDHYDELELYAINGDEEDEGIDWVEVARVGLFPPLYCVK